MKMLPLIVALSLVPLASLPCLAHAAPAADLPTVEEVLARFVAAVGGQEALQRVDVRRCEGTIVQDLSWTDPTHQEAPFVVVLSSPEQEFSYFALYFDLETGLLNHIGYHNEILEYRRVDGVCSPYRMVFGRKGGHTTYVLSEVTIEP